VAERSASSARVKNGQPGSIRAASKSGLPATFPQFGDFPLSAPLAKNSVLIFLSRQKLEKNMKLSPVMERYVLH
jgi:hypothetical protein